jgi:hypothetical protein
MCPARAGPDRLGFAGLRRLRLTYEGRAGPVRLGPVRLELVRLELVRLELVRLELVRLELVRLELVRLGLVAPAPTFRGVSSRGHQSVTWPRHTPRIFMVNST